MSDWFRRHRLSFRWIMSLATSLTTALILELLGVDRKHLVYGMLGAGIGTFLSIAAMQKYANQNRQIH